MQVLAAAYFMRQVAEHASVIYMAVVRVAQIRAQCVITLSPTLMSHSL